MALGWRKNYIRYQGFFLNVYSAYKNRQDVKVFMELLLTLATIGILAVLALRPTITTIIELVNQINAKEELIAKMDQKIQNLATAQTLYAKESKRIDLLNSAIPTSPDPDKLMQQLQGVTAKNQVAVTSISVGEVELLGDGVIKKKKSKGVTLPEGAKSLDFSVNAAGDYNLIKNLLSDLEKTLRPTVFDNFTIVASDDDIFTLSTRTSAKSAYYEEGQE